MFPSHDRKGGRLRDDEINLMLNNDITDVYRDLRKALPWYDKAPERVQRGLCNMCFQMGLSGLLRFKNTLKLLEQKRYEEAADEALNSTWAKQTPERAKRVTDLFRNADK